MGDYKAEDGERETVVLSKDNVETLANDDGYIVKETESSGDVEFYNHSSYGSGNYDYGANSGNWQDLLNGDKDELTWYHIPVRAVMDETDVGITINVGDMDPDVAEEMGYALIGHATELDERGKYECAEDLHRLGVDIVKYCESDNEDAEIDPNDISAVQEYLNEQTTWEVIDTRYEDYDLYTADLSSNEIDIPDGWVADTHSNGTYFKQVE